MPLAIRDHVLYLAMSDPLDDAALAEVRLHTQLPIRAIVTSRSAVEDLFQRLYSDRYIRIATVDLLNRSPDESAFRVLTHAQKIVFSVAALLFVLALVYDPIKTLIGFNIVSVGFYGAFSLYKFKLIYDAISANLELPISPEEIADLDERELPIYTILIPLYREVAVLPRPFGTRRSRGSAAAAADRVRCGQAECRRVARQTSQS